jgi:hypothetical protein
VQLVKVGHSRPGVQSASFTTPPGQFCAVHALPLHQVHPSVPTDARVHASQFVCDSHTASIRHASAFDANAVPQVTSPHVPVVGHHEQCALMQSSQVYRTVHPSGSPGGEQLLKSQSRGAPHGASGPTDVPVTHARVRAHQPQPDSATHDAQLVAGAQSARSEDTRHEASRAEPLDPREEKSRSDGA